MVFIPDLTVLPPPQRKLWLELAATPQIFTLYGGTALALRTGHRTSIDFDFFSNEAFDQDQLVKDVPYLFNAERIQAAPNTLTCRIERGGPVLVSFFGALGLGQAAMHDTAAENGVRIASLLDIAGTKAAVVQKRAEAKDYLDIVALLQHGISLPMMLAAGSVIYGRNFNPLITLKALSYFDDVQALPASARAFLCAAVAAVDVTNLPIIEPYRKRPETGPPP